MYGVNSISCNFKLREIVFLVFAILVIAGLFALGVWQIERLKLKNALITKIEQQSSKAPINIDETANIDVLNLLYSKIIVSGNFEPNFNLYRYQYHNNKAVYEVFNIFRLNSGQKLLVKRDFTVDEPNFKLLKNEVSTITTIVLKPAKQGMFALSNNFINDLIFNIDIASINKHYKQNLAEDIYLLQLKHGESEKITQDILANIHNQHKLYAITWFSLCIIIIIMTFLKFKFIK
jgi:surfeit locus 1 family protein